MEWEFHAWHERQSRLMITYRTSEAFSFQLSTAWFPLHLTNSFDLFLVFTQHQISKPTFAIRKRFCSFLILCSSPHLFFAQPLRGKFDEKTNWVQSEIFKSFTCYLIISYHTHESYSYSSLKMFVCSRIKLMEVFCCVSPPPFLVFL